MTSAVYRLHHLTLRVRHGTGGTSPDLGAVLAQLSFASAEGGRGATRLQLTVRQAAAGVDLPPGAGDALRPGRLAWGAGNGDVWLSEGTSLLRVYPQGQAVAWIAPGFATQPQLVRQRFWAFGVLSLLRARGLYALHAAALVGPEGAGVLLIGPSDSGKSTLAMGLIGAGWHYLSDDAVLLVAGAGGIHALALRRPFAVADAAWPAGKRSVDLRGTRPAQFCAAARPAVLVFPRITGAGSSHLRPIPPAAALARVLESSGPELFADGAMGIHLRVLGALVSQTACYELRAGGDLHRRPALFADLLQQAGGTDAAADCRAHRSL